MKKTHTYIASVLLILCAGRLSAEVFRFKYKAGDTYRILTAVEESVSVNSQFHHNAEIINRISVEVIAVEGASGKHSVTFMATERSTGTSGKALVWGEEYESVFLRDPKGRYTIDDVYFMPVVRDVPVFPDGDIEPGAKWTARGEEAHDLRRTFGITKPFKVPFTASYEYTGALTEDGKTLHIITARYTMQFESPAQRLPQVPPDARGPAEIPLLTTGFSNQIIYFDAERGLIDHYTEEFKISIRTDKGNLYEFEGVSRGEMTEYEADAASHIGEVRRQVSDLMLENVEVVADEKGLTLRIENIQFLADSAALLESEKTKLRALAEILAEFPDNDLLVSGHTALAGTAQGQQRLSEERARSVADYLMSLGVRDAYHIFTQGFGATKPIAPNTDRQGMEKNRRVEITILNK